MTSPLVLTIDVGSSSVRANLFVGDARQLREYETQIPYKYDTAADGGVEIAAEALVGAVFSAVDGTVEKAGGLAAGIRGVGMCSLVPNVVGVDEAGVAVTPVYTWADTRPTAQAEGLRARLDEAEVRERTGCPIHPSYLPAKLLWIKQTMPDVYEKVATWVSVGDLVHLRLFGRGARQSLSVASWSGLLNRHTLRWDGDMLGAIEVDDSKLPLLVDLDEPVAGLVGGFAARWPQLREVPWFPCVGDGVTSNLGSGCAGPEEIAVQVGTSGALRALVPGKVERIPSGLWCYRMDRDTALLGGALSEGGNLLDWLYGLLRIEDRRGLEHEAARMKPDSHGLTVLPFVAGERSPGWRGDARAAIVGLSLDTKLEHIVRACQEAVAYRFGLLFDLLREELPVPGRIVASGGALLGVEGWVGMLADVVGMPVTASGEKEASSRGTALLVLQSLGDVRDLGEVPALLGKAYAPDMERHAVYRRGMERQVELYGRLL